MLQQITENRRIEIVRIGYVFCWIQFDWIGLDWIGVLDSFTG